MLNNLEEYKSNDIIHVSPSLMLRWAEHYTSLPYATLGYTLKTNYSKVQ